MNYPYGWPPMNMYGPPIYGGLPDESVALAKAIIKQHKVDKKRKAEEEKKKEAKSKPRSFTFFETCGIIMLGSIPFTMFQLYLLGLARDALNNAFVPH